MCDAGTARRRRVAQHVPDDRAGRRRFGAHAAAADRHDDGRPRDDLLAVRLRHAAVRPRQRRRLPRRPAAERLLVDQARRAVVAADRDDPPDGTVGPSDRRRRRLLGRDLHAARRGRVDRARHAAAAARRAVLADGRADRDVVHRLAAAVAVGVDVVAVRDDRVRQRLRAADRVLHAVVPGTGGRVGLHRDVRGRNG